MLAGGGEGTEEAEDQVAFYIAIDNKNSNISDSVVHTY